MYIVIKYTSPAKEVVESVTGPFNDYLRAEEYITNSKWKKIAEYVNIADLPNNNF